MEHKAFVFDYVAFDEELRGLLCSELQGGSGARLKEFVSRNLESLKDPYEGMPLTDDWERMINSPDAHQYGDFALTKYYDPSDDIGLGYDWESLHNLFRGSVIPGESPVLGVPLGTEGNLFDPGKMGSYLQSPSRVKDNLARLRLKPEAGDVIAMLEHAASCRKGLYITF